MIARVLISPSPDKRAEEIKTILSRFGAKFPHPDLLLFPKDSKLGIEQARQIKAHFLLKPFQAKGRAAVLEEASGLTAEAQNALLKTIEELTPNSLLILAASSEHSFLPTILSRCQVTKIAENYNTLVYHSKFEEDLHKLLEDTFEERFEYIANLKERADFFHYLIKFFRDNLPSHIGNTDYINFLKEVLQAEEWTAQNVNIRTILEYLMLVMPKVESGR
ncbi:hypothetical protein A3C26_03735 [Candidatus Daviesbacteria bacterium RIFCSPHIGHO2_02_FULL_39_12]|uniref:DNA polymerase III delta N-terminal domain-containing protein n=2 Tax=Candidatus Daviesiibacteriota TaxID=1752718 RepID=A0A1F5JCB6_9BACT|nr:MAG: hypothetical protein A3C26_03735 [Candidatus Daviesbacteria bacterium RIFCSPHIGHO2_02_FULL_39_12]OGE71652.1 MAG: hypothetical protein A3H40_01430 [Candidatus Daviesbacteria bacterium RIFCSPLOWO2_02_FULL_38_15]